MPTFPNNHSVDIFVTFHILNKSLIDVVGFCLAGYMLNYQCLKRKYDLYNFKITMFPVYVINSFMFSVAH